MTKKDRHDKQKDIDDVLSSIDSLLDTATDANTDDLPVLNLDDETKIDATETDGNSEKLVAPKKQTIAAQKPNKKTVPKTIKATKKKSTVKPAPTRVTKNNNKKQQLKEQGNKNSNVTAASKIKPDIHKPMESQQSKPTEKADAKLNFSTVKTDFSLAHRELPVLDEIITEEEMALIASGKVLPKRVISEKFVPKSTTDKIIDLIAIQLADYNITRLEYEYIHELIDELLNEQDKKTK